MLNAYLYNYTFQNEINGVETLQNNDNLKSNNNTVNSNASKP